MLVFQPELGNCVTFGLKTTNGYVEFDIAINPNDYLYKWTHIVATYESGTMSLYSNGVLIGTTSSQTGDILFNSSNPLLIGSYIGSQEFFKHKIGRPAIYTTVLNASQVLSNYNTYKPIFDAETLSLNLDAGLLSSYSGTGTTWYDLTSNGNNGTLTNGVSYSLADGGGTMIFDGVDDYIDTNFIPTIEAGSITYEVWFKTNTAQTGGIINVRSASATQFVLALCNSVGGYGSNLLVYSYNNVFDRAAASTETWVDNIWHCAVAVHTSETDILYVDGVLRASATTSPLDINNLTKLRIGGLGDGSSMYPNSNIK